MQVRLTQFEVYLASLAAVRRRLASWGSSETNKVENSSFGWHTDIEAACAEMAAAKALNLYWSGSVNTYKLPDVGEGPAALQIRHTERSNGCLIIRREDRSRWRYLLVTGRVPLFDLRGWILGSDGCKEEWWRELEGLRSAWFIPQDALRPVEELIACRGVPYG